MGRVDLVVRTEGTFRRLYALKRLHENLRSDPEVRQSFLDEARIAGLLRHPNVVSVLDVGEDEDGPFLVMDYVEGVSVAAMLRRAQKEKREIPLQICLRTIMQAAEGLHAAHLLAAEDGTPLRLVHRDVSPPNILIGFDGIVRVTDFGVAKALGRLSHTHGGVLKGKLGYMSPEQLRFEPIDHRSDLFALGIVLFEMLSGRRLYWNKEGTEGTRRLLTEPPPDLADVRDDAPPALVQLVFSLLAKKPELRPGSALEVKDRLEDVLAECVAEEGRLEIASYLGETMDDVRQRRADEVTDALTGLGRTPAKKLEAAPPPRRWPYAVAATIALTVGVALYVGAQSSAKAPSVAAAVPPPPEPKPEPEAEAEAEPEVAPAVEAEPAPKPKPVERKKRRRKTKKRAAKKRDGVPMWEWE